MFENNRFFKYSLGTILVLVIIYLLGKIDYLLMPIKTIMSIALLPIIIAGLFYYIFRPLVRYLENKGVNRSISILLVFLAVAALLTFMSISGGSFIKKEFTNFYNIITKQLELTQKSTKNILQEGNWWIFSIEDLETRFIALIESLFQTLTVNMAGLVSTVANIGTLIVLIPFVLFYLLKDGEIFVENFMKVIPKGHKDKTAKLLHNIDNTLSTYITGQLLVATVTGIITYIGYLIIGLPNALVLAIVTIITSIIPFLGVFIGLMPALFIALTIDWFMIVKVLIVVVIAQQIEGNLISPNILGQRLNIHPLTIIFIVIIAISLFGVIGAFMAVPTYSVVKVIVKHFME